MQKTGSLRAGNGNALAILVLAASIVAFLSVCYWRVNKGDTTSFARDEVAIAFSESGTNRAILIGVDDYFGADERFDLKYASADVELMRERLIELGFHPENIVALTTNNGKKAPEFEPNLANLDKTLADLLAKTRPNDSVFVFFSGHGFQTRKFFGLRQYAGFAPSDASWRPDGRLDVSTTFALSKFLNVLAKKEAKFKWVVVDACRETLGPKDAKGGVESAAAFGEHMSALKARAGLFILQSCVAGQYSYENDVFQHGVFTYCLAESLGPEGDTNGDGAIRFWEAISRTAQKTSEAQPRQEPSLSCVETRDFILTSRSGETPEPPDAASDSSSPGAPIPSTPDAASDSSSPGAPIPSTPDAASDLPSPGAPISEPPVVEAEEKTLPPEESESARLYRLGRALAFGLDGRKIDQAAGFERLKAATVLGSLDAQAELAELYLDGCVGTKADHAEAFDLATEPANAGNPFAQNVLAICYRDGLCARQDEMKAAKLFQDACVGFRERAESDVRAATALGKRYFRGEGVEKNVKEAERLFLPAAESGYVQAMEWLARCYATGNADEKREALKWFLKAAELNDATAMSELGRLYERGSGVALDRAEAAKWYRRAAALGNEEAGWRLTALEEYERRVQTSNFEELRSGSSAPAVNSACPAL